MSVYLNENNFLIWHGAANRQIPEFEVDDVFVDFFANVDLISFDPITPQFATLGVNTYSLEVVKIEDFLTHLPIELGKPNEYNGIDKFTFYRPVDLSLILVAIFFRFRDDSGNISPTFRAFITMSSVTVAWVQDPSSAFCILDSFGQNNGYQAWTQLKLQNAITHVDISPLQVKPNLIGDPDYYYPEINLGSCPTPTGSTYASLIIANFSQNPSNIPAAYITINQITLACSACGSGGTPMILNFPCNIPPGSTLRINVPAIFWDTGLTIQYAVTGDMVAVANPVLWRSNVNGVVDNFPTGGVHQVDNSGIYGNYSITVTSPNGLTIFCQ